VNLRQSIVLCAALASLVLAVPASAGEAAAPQPTELASESMEMWSVGAETHAVFTGSVTLTATNLRIVCDRLEIIAEGIEDSDPAAPPLDKFKYLLATGNVRIVQGEREATAARIEVLPREDRVVLTGNPVVTDKATGFTQYGSRITMLRGERRVIVENSRTLGPPISDLGFEKEAPAEPSPDAAK